MWMLWGENKEQRSVWIVKTVDVLRPQLPTACHLLEWHNTSLSIHLSCLCSGTSYTTCYDFQRAPHSLNCSPEAIQECHQQSMNLARTVLAGSLPVKGAQLSALVPSLLSASVHVTSSAVLLPSPRISGHIVPGTLGGKSSRHHQNPGLWVHSIILVGRDEIVSPQTTAHHQLSGHLP